MSSQRQLYTINGAVDTAKTVWSNIEAIASSAAAWITFDVQTGLWSVIINEPDVPKREFNDTNILGTITLSETPFMDMYNAVQVGYPNRDIADQRDYIRRDIEQIQRYPNEPNNQLNIESDLINDPVQAEVIALTELKQSRLNKVIQFDSDFTAMGLNAGDIIAVTNEQFAWNQKLFRIITIEEEDGEAGEIVLRFTCLEYDLDVYDYSDIVRFGRTQETGIQPISLNTSIRTLENISTGNKVGEALQTDQGRAAITGAGVPVLENTSAGWSASLVDSAFQNNTVLESVFDITGNPAKLLLVFIEGPLGEFAYDVRIDGATVNRTINAGFPCQVTLYRSTDSGNTYSLVSSRFMDWQTYTTTFSVPNAGVGRYKVAINRVVTYDLNQEGADAVVTPTAWTTASNSNGDGSTYSVVLFEN